MTQLKALGGLRLESTSFTQPKPLVLLSYLSLEGAKSRRHLAELFWQGGNRMKSLSMTLTRLRQGAGEVIEVDETLARTKLSSDAKTLLEALDKSQWQEASDLYQGAFLEGIVLEDWSSELEEWVYTTREYLAERVQHALLNLAEAAAKEQDFDKTGELAERAYKLPGLAGSDISSLKRLYPLLSAGNSLLAPAVRKELEGYDISVQLSRDEARARFQDSKTTNQLPSRQTSFVGRDVELTELASTLANIQLLTLLGTAGVGKTRLALQLAHEQQKLGAFESVYFVTLESLNSSELIVPTILSTLGLTQQANTEPLKQLTDFMAGRSVLLVLDNLEHLLDNVQVLSQLLQQCPNLKLLVTSRERLDLEEEHLFPLEGLSFPTSETSLAEARTFDAVDLFKQRAQQVNPQFELKQNLEAVLRICKLVEGLPLGLELAASWVRVMSCDDIAQEVERGLEFLTTTTRNVPERHRSLKAAFEQSWKLLKPKEQEVLRKLSVFVGGFRREAASEVTGATIPLLASLVDKSLLRVLPNGRYDRHPLLHQFTHEKLAENPEELFATRDRHTALYLRLSEQAEPLLYSREAKTWLDRFDEELNNVRSVLIRIDHETGLRLLTNLAWFWATRGLYKEARSYLKTFLELAPDATSSLYIKGLYTLADFTWQQGDFIEAQTQLEKALLLAKKVQDKHALPRTLGLLARIYQRNHNDKAKARALYEECIAVAEEVGDRKNKASALNLMAIILKDEGDFEAAESLYQKSLTLWREVEHSSGVAEVLNNIAGIYNDRGDYEKAQELFEESLELSRDLGVKFSMSMTLLNLGLNAIRRGLYPRASELLHEGLRLARESGEKFNVAGAIFHLGTLAFRQTDYLQAQLLYEEAHNLYLELDYKVGLGDTFRHLGETYYAKGEWEKARNCYQEGLSLCRSLGDLWGIANTTRLLAILDIEQEKYEAAKTLLEESLRLAGETKSQIDNLLALEGFALLETSLGKAEKAVGLWGVCQALRQTLGAQPDSLEQKRYEKAVKHLRQQLGREFEGLFREGQSMKLEQALEFVQENSGSSPQQATTTSASAEQRDIDPTLLSN